MFKALDHLGVGRDHVLQLFQLGHVLELEHDPGGPGEAGLGRRQRERDRAAAHLDLEGGVVTLARLERLVERGAVEAGQGLLHRAADLVQGREPRAGMPVVEQGLQVGVAGDDQPDADRFEELLIEFIDIHLKLRSACQDTLTI
jgi:hypothetical protein